MNVAELIGGLRSFVEKRDYRGYDPYDALNSPLIRLLSFNLKYGRIAWIQLLKRLPVNVRPLLFVPPGHNPKGLGLFLWGYARLYRISPKQDRLAAIGRLLDLLDELRSRGYSGNSWGYDFDWQSRTFYLPALTPTIVNTAFIGHALLDTHRYNGNSRALDLALPIKDFLLNDLSNVAGGNRFCFSYSPLDRTAVHNANLLGASLLARLYSLTGDTSLRDAVLRSVEYTMAHQHEDGSWFYAEAAGQRWIDSFHTGFNLQAIRYILNEGLAEDYRHAYEKGIDFYAGNFFLPDGTPKYYHDRLHPIDIHAPAQAIAFFSGTGDADNGLTDRVLAWLVNNMRDPKQGYFYFRKGRIMTNRIPYMRWSQAWVFHALTEYMLCRENPQKRESAQT